MQIYLQWFSDSTLFVQKTKIIDSYHFWPERGLRFSLLQSRPVDSFEEWVRADVSHNTQPASGISLKQLG